MALPVARLIEGSHTTVICWPCRSLSLSSSRLIIQLSYSFSRFYRSSMVKHGVLAKDADKTNQRKKPTYYPFCLYLFFFLSLMGTGWGMSGVKYLNNTTILIFTLSEWLRRAENFGSGIGEKRMRRQRSTGVRARERGGRSKPDGTISCDEAV